LFSSRQTSRASSCYAQIGAATDTNTPPSSVRRFVGYLSALGVTKPPMLQTPRELARAALRRDYEHYLRRQRGLSERTIGHCWRFADRFLDLSG
jgi:hypothetical protein